MGVVRTLASRGHDVIVAIHERDAKVGGLVEHPRVRVVPLPDGRRDRWADTADLARPLRDLLQYFGEPYRGARKLRGRVFERLMKAVGAPKEVARSWSAEQWLALGEEALVRINRALAALEEATPPDQLALEALRRMAPEVLLVTPLIHFGGLQVEIVKAARELGIPVGMMLFSWDNLSTKGAMHCAPDHLFVWNEQQRAEAALLHGIPAERVTVTGAPRFDRFFERRSTVAPGAVRKSLGVGADVPIVLYLCSSRLVSEKEIRFLRQWIAAVRRSPHPRVSRACLLIRPHPDLPLAEGSWTGEERAFTWDGLSGVELRARPIFGDPAALTLTSDYEASQVLYESIFHSTAVVGLNTSAEIEAGIVGRPVFTILTDDAYADGQASTLHFHYLTEPHGGFVRVASDLDAHVADLAAEIERPTAPAAWQSRVAAFVRPAGWDVPAAAVLADAVERFAGSRADRREEQRSPELVPAHRPLPSTEAPGARKVHASARLRPMREAGVELWAVETTSSGLAPSARAALEWLVPRVTPGAVVYDLTARDGHFALAVARRTGCSVMAFETNLASLGLLWQNVLANQCDGLVVPLPVRAGGKSRLLMDRYAAFAPDADRLPLRTPLWRGHDPAPGAEVLQPVMSVPLGWAIRRWKLPPPAVVRAILGPDEAEVLAAVEGVSESTLSHLVLEGLPDALARASAHLAGHGWRPDRSAAGGRTDVLGYNRVAKE
ncbi:MAG: hypothetical protein AB1635_00820 [Acidobacteriota bacterium]